MRILFDHGAPAPLRRFLKGHSVTLARDKGWSTLSNGELLKRAEADKFDILLTTDKNLGYQQNLTGRNIAILVLEDGDWSVLRHFTEGVVKAVDSAAAGDYVEIPVPTR